MERLTEFEQNVAELELAIKWAHGASIMDEIPEVSYLFSLCEVALKEKLERLENSELPNAPLTLEELREMDGERVWVKLLNGIKPFLGTVDKESNVVFWGTGYDPLYGGYATLNRNCYGERWLAYSRNPDEDGNWENN